MKSNRTIEIIVAPSGEISINAIGFKGADCDAATKFLEEALGTTSSKRTKPEHLQSRKLREHQRIQR